MLTMGRATPAFRELHDELAELRARGRAVELIDGEVVPKASPSPAHGSTQRKLGALVDGFDGDSGGAGGPGGWWLMSEVEVPYAQTDEVFRHDLLGFRRDRHSTLPDGLPVRARPDWVAEVLSPSTARFDVVKKQRTLHRHEVPHYWLVDPSNSLLTVLAWSPERYLRVLDAGIGDVVRAEPFDAIELDVGELFGVAS